MGHPGKSNLEISRMLSKYNKHYFEFCMNFFSRQLNNQPKTASRKAPGDKNSCNRVTQTQMSGCFKNGCSWLDVRGLMVIAHALIAKGLV
jgi:hypothetical protein